VCARGLAARFPFSSSGVTFNALHPGLVNTGLLSKAGLSSSTISTALSVEDGAATAVFLASAPEVRGVSGAYFADSAVVRPPEVSAWALSDAEADALWAASLEFVGMPAAEFGQSRS
jgi:NAD(P)-dependent dehydrogenase (short-subunit alcohol dehydrogenase family)